MKHLFKRQWIAIANTCVLIMSLSTFFAESWADDSGIELLPESELALYGESTIRDFSSEATVIKVTGKIEADKKSIADGLNVKLGNFVIVIPISGLKSKNKTLDEHLSEAMKAGKFPEIRGVLKGYEVLGKDEEDSYNVRASVDLTIAGVSKLRSVDGTVTVEGDKIRIEGEKKLLMTDFGIDPPRVMLGMIKVSDEIVVRFDLLLAFNKIESKRSRNDQNRKI